LIVIDASAAVAALVNAGPARRALAAGQVHAPHLIDSEVANALRRTEAGGRIQTAAAAEALHTWSHVGVIRYAVIGLLERIWQLRANLTAYDASYVALAEALDCVLVTCDAKIARAPGLKCPITVVPG
jgi:predicted nucleic acid-binding protein